MRKTFGTIALAVACAVLATPAPASARQTLNFTFGYFAVRGEDARVEHDILNENRNFLSFEVADFNGPAVGVEWLVPLGQFIEAGAGVAFSRRTVPSVYEKFVDTDGSEIEQDLRLRLVPVAFTVRLIPLGQTSSIQPYFGAGLGVFNWRYSESGEFVDFQNRNAIFRNQYVASGNETGAIALGGLRFAGDTVSAGAEIRYQGGDADLGGGFAGVSRDARIDLGGWTYQFTVGKRW
jgi:outer membrane protein W